MFLIRGYYISDKDPLNAIMGVLGTLVTLSAIGTYLGYGQYIASVLVPLTALAYLKAPSRRYPTANFIVRAL